MAMKLNPDIIKRREVARAVKENGGYCPCMLDKNQDTKCPCKDKRELEVCICGLYVRVGEE